MSIRTRVFALSVAVAAGLVGPIAPAAADLAGDGPSPEVFEAALESVGQDAVETENPAVAIVDSDATAVAVLATTGSGPLVVTAQDAASSAVLERPDGAQLLTALDPGQTTATFTLGGVARSLLPLPDGGVAVVGGDGVIVGQVQSPWAVDADGAEVPTQYRIEGTTLVQQVQITGDTEFPVVVDPYVSSQFSWGLWTHVLSKDLTATMASGTVEVAAILLAFIPTAGPVIAAMASIIRLAASNARAAGGCLLLRAAVTPGNIYWAGTYIGSRCRAR